MRTMGLFVFTLTTTFTLACGGTADVGKRGESDKPGHEAAGDGAPKTQLTLAKTQAIADGLSFGEGFQKGMANAQSDSFMLSFAGPENARGGKVNVVISGVACMPMSCVDLDVTAWKKNENLKKKLAEVHIKNPNLVWEVTGIQVGGKRAIQIYAMSYVETQGADGTTRASTKSIDLWWHDGGVLLNVTANASAFPSSLEELETKVTRAELEATAKLAFEATVAKL